MCHIELRELVQKLSYIRGTQNANVYFIVKLIVILSRLMNIYDTLSESEYILMCVMEKDWKSS